MSDYTVVNRIGNLEARLVDDGYLDDPIEEDEEINIIHFSNRYRNYQNPYDLLHMTDDGELRANEQDLQDKLDNGYAFFLSCYSHGVEVWSLQGEGPQCRWDTSSYAGLIVFDGPPSNFPKTYEKRKAYFRTLLNQYTDYANGHGYAIQIVEILTDEDGYEEDGEVLDSCYGYYSSELEHVKSVAEEMLEFEVKKTQTLTLPNL